MDDIRLDPPDESYADFARRMGAIADSARPRSRYCPACGRHRDHWAECPHPAIDCPVRVFPVGWSIVPEGSRSTPEDVF